MDHETYVVTQPPQIVHETVTLPGFNQTITDVEKVYTTIIDHETYIVTEPPKVIHDTITLSGFNQTVTEFETEKSQLSLTTKLMSSPKLQALSLCRASPKQLQTMRLLLITKPMSSLNQSNTLTIPGSAGHNKTFAYTSTVPGPTITVTGSSGPTITKVITQQETVTIPGPVGHNETFTYTSTVTGPAGPVATVTGPAGPTITKIVTTQAPGITITIPGPAGLNQTFTYTSTITGPAGPIITITGGTSTITAIVTAPASTVTSPLNTIFAL